MASIDSAGVPGRRGRARNDCAGRKPGGEHELGRLRRAGIIPDAGPRLRERTATGLLPPDARRAQRPRRRLAGAPRERGSRGERRGPRLGAGAGRERLGRAQLARGIRRRRPLRLGAVHLQAGDGRGRGARGGRPGRLPDRAHRDRPRQRGAEGEVSLRHPLGRHRLVPGLLRAGRRLRPCLRPDARRPRRRRVRDQRPEDLDEQRPQRGQHVHPRADGPGRAEASRHLVDHHRRHPRGRRAGAPADRHDVQAPLQRDLLRGRARPRLQPHRRGRTAAGTSA